MSTHLRKSRMSTVSEEPLFSTQTLESSYPGATNRVGPGVTEDGHGAVLGS